MVTLQKSEKYKNHSNRVKIAPKQVKITLKRVKITQKSEFHFLGVTKGQLKTRELSLSGLPKKMKFTLLEWFLLALEWFSLIWELFLLH